MILEAIVTTTDAAGELNIAPMGPLMEPGTSRFELRPFESAQTYKNLLQNPFGVLHVTDDVMLFAGSAINRLDFVPQTRPASSNNGRIVSDCCYWMEFTAQHIATDTPRKTFHCNVTAEGSARRFFGFNRAKHAVLEATILATRIEFLPREEIDNQFARLKTIVEKTGSVAETAAFELLTRYVAEFNG